MDGYGLRETIEFGFCSAEEATDRAQEIHDDNDGEYHLTIYVALVHSSS